MSLVLSLSIIFACLLVGELLAALFGLPLPGSIIGLVILTVLLQTKVVKVEWIEKTANVLIKYMSFFFIPPGVGLICYLGLLKAQWCPIVVSCVVSTLFVLASSALVYKLALKVFKNKS